MLTWLIRITSTDLTVVALLPNCQMAEVFKYMRKLHVSSWLALWLIAILLRQCLKKRTGMISEA